MLSIKSKLLHFNSCTCDLCDQFFLYLGWLHLQHPGPVPGEVPSHGPPLHKIQVREAIKNKYESSEIVRNLSPPHTPSPQGGRED